MAKDFRDVAFLIGKKLNQVIEANLRRKFAHIRIVRPDGYHAPAREGGVDVILDKSDKIKGFQESA